MAIAAQTAMPVGCQGIDTSLTVAPSFPNAAAARRTQASTSGCESYWPKPSRHHRDFQFVDALAERARIGVELEPVLARVVAVGAGHHLERERVLGDPRGERPGVVDGRVHAHDARIGNEAPGGFHADHAAVGGGDADRTALVAAGREIDLAGRDQRARAGGRAAGVVAHGARVVHRAGDAGRRAAGEREIFAHRFADDLGAGIEEPRYDGGVELRDIALEHRRAVGERDAGDRIGILDGDLLAGELALGRALDAALGDPGAVAVLLALRPVIAAARIFDGRQIVGQRQQLAIAGGERRQIADDGVGIIGRDVHAEIFADLAQLIWGGQFEGHGSRSVAGVRTGTVIASEAKQSRTARRTGLLRRFAPRNDEAF